MRVTEITIKRFLGIADRKLECGQITTVAGSNASGKTSILEAIKAALGGGDLGKLAMVGQEEPPELVLVMDGGRYRVERYGKETVVKERVGDTAAYEKINRPQTWLNDLFDPMLTNPLRFLQAHPNDRADILLEVLPLRLDRDAFMTALHAWPKGPDDAARPLIEGHPLAVLSYARTVLYDERTGVNRSQKDKAASAYELQKQMPADMPGDPMAVLEEANAAKQALVQDVSARVAKANADYSAATEAANAARTARHDVIQAEFKTAAAKVRSACADKVADLERQIAALRAQAEVDVAHAREDAQAVMDDADQDRDQAVTAADKAHDAAIAEIDAVRAKLDAATAHAATVGAQARDYDRLVQTKAMADQFQQEADSLQATADALTADIETVDTWKRNLITGLPIDGLEIVGKQIMVHGIPFDQLNMAQRYKIAVQVAVLRAKEEPLPIVFVDGAEALDSEQYALLVKELEGAGVQAFIAKVTDAPLDVQVANPTGAAKVTRMPPPTPRTTPRKGGRSRLEE